MSRRPDPIRRAVAEGIGVFALVFAGCGAIVAEDQHPGALGTVGISLVVGLVVMAMVYATGHLSGGLAYQVVRGEHPADLGPEGA